MESDPAIHELERHVGVREGLFQRLLEEDDWSFVIKLHALLEAVCTHLLLFHFQEPHVGLLGQRSSLV